MSDDETNFAADIFANMLSSKRADSYDSWIELAGL
jgi:hypothetical protein